MLKYVFFLLLLSIPALALPSPQAAEDLVHRISGWSLKALKEKGSFLPVPSKEAAGHSQDFSSKYLELILFVSAAQPGS